MHEGFLEIWREDTVRVCVLLVVSVEAVLDMQHGHLGTADLHAPVFEKLSLGSFV
jgi:hypothetical protein